MTFSRCATLTLALLGLSTSGYSQSTAANPDDGLNMRFANGVAAVVENKVITVDDIRKEIAPMLPQLQRDARNEEDFNKRLEGMQDSIIQELIDRVLIIKEFRKDEKKQIPPGFIDSRIADIQSQQFDNDRSKFLAFLRSRGTTLRTYRTEVEDDIIYTYMRQQQRKSQSIVSPVRMETYYEENKERFQQEDSVHLRLIQLNQASDESEAQLLTRAMEVIGRFKRSESFADLAKEYSEDSRRSKGGDWGWQKRSDLKKEFSSPLFNLDKGEITDPVLTPEGCFLLYAEDRKYAGIQPIDDVRDTIERILIQRMSSVSEERWLEKLRRNGYVKHY